MWRAGRPGTTIRITRGREEGELADIAFHDTLRDEETAETQRTPCP